MLSYTIVCSDIVNGLSRSFDPALRRFYITCPLLMDNAQIAHIPSSPTFASKSRFTNIVKDAIHYLKVPFPDKDRFGRPRSNSANTIASW